MLVTDTNKRKTNNFVVSKRLPDSHRQNFIGSSKSTVQIRNRIQKTLLRTTLPASISMSKIVLLISKIISNIRKFTYRSVPIIVTLHHQKKI
jgi:hypothetical protein